MLENINENVIEEEVLVEEEKEKEIERKLREYEDTLGY